MTVYIGRRELLGAFGAAVTWPLAVRAQQPRRIGVLMGIENPQTKNQFAAFREALRSLGWIDGQTIQIEHRAAPDPDGLRSAAAELLSQGPDLMVTASTHKCGPTSISGHADCIH